MSPDDWVRVLPLVLASPTSGLKGVGDALDELGAQMSRTCVAKGRRWEAGRDGQAFRHRIGYIEAANDLIEAALDQLAKATETGES